MGLISLKLGLLNCTYPSTYGIRGSVKPNTNSVRAQQENAGAVSAMRREDGENTSGISLEEIIRHKEKQVSQFKEKIPLAMLKESLENAPPTPTRDVIGALKEAGQRTGSPALIAEVKKASPIKGVLRPDFHPDDGKNDLKVKEWEVAMLQNEVAASQGIRIWRRSPRGPPLHSFGPLEFRSQNDGSTPRSILEEIIWHKDKQVSQFKEKMPLAMLKKSVEKVPPASNRDFIGALKEAGQRTGSPALIAEVKKASPTKGVLRPDFHPVEIAQSYEEGGAACLSVLTDEKYFQGSFENLEAIRNAGVKCPLLCKDFVIDEWQIYYARTKGADAILLIAAVLPDLEIRYMTKICKRLGLAALVEVHNEREMDRVLAIEGIELIGISNRNLETFEVDICNTRKLLEGERGELIRQKDIIVVAESGMFTPEDIAYVQEAGVRAVLIGESLVKQSEPGKAIAGLFGKDISL